MTLSYTEAAKLLDAQLLSADAEIASRPCHHFAFDSRKIAHGDTFVAFEGEACDGHDFLQAAREAGAFGAIVSRACPQVDLLQLVVADTTKAIQSLAREYRKAYTGTIIGITGSNGKTSTKNILHSILSQEQATYLTPGNYNNHLGVPYSLSRLDNHSLAIIEIGTSGPGEIAFLTELVRPEIALITCINNAHLEKLKNRPGVALEKSQIYTSNRLEYAILPCDTPEIEAILRARIPPQATSQRVGIAAEAEVVVGNTQLLSSGKTSFVYKNAQQEHDYQIPLLGKHFATLAAMAIAVARYLGHEQESIRKGLAAVTPTKGRLYPHKLAWGLLLDDTYNANPDSLLAGMKTCLEFPGDTYLVLGELNELGSEPQQLFSSDEFQEAFRKFRKTLVIGSRIFQYIPHTPDSVYKFASKAELLQELQKDTDYYKSLETSTLSVLVKASRGAAFDEIVENLLQSDTP